MTLQDQKVLLQIIHWHCIIAKAMLFCGRQVAVFHSQNTILSLAFFFMV